MTITVQCFLFKNPIYPTTFPIIYNFLGVLLKQTYISTTTLGNNLGLICLGPWCEPLRVATIVLLQKELLTKIQAQARTTVSDKGDGARTATNYCPARISVVRDGNNLSKSWNVLTGIGQISIR